MYMDEGMDTGDMILKQEVEIGEDETTGELWDKLTKIGGELLVKTLDLIEQGKAPKEKQGEDFTMAPMLSKEMAKIDWQNQTAEQIKNLIRGLNPIMGAYTFLDGKKLKFWKAKLMSEQELLTTFPELKEYEYKLNELEAGTILFTNPKQGLFIKAKQGILQILEIQAENAKRMSTSDFLRGNNIQAGSILE